MTFLSKAIRMKQTNIFGVIKQMEKRPPPYFPQSSLNPADDNRYKKFKLIVGSVIAGVILLLTAAGFGIYYLINWLF